MARSVLQLAFVSAEKVQFDDVHLVKLFFGDEADGQRDLGVSLLSMQSSPEALDEVWEACKRLDVLETASVTVEIDRGSKNAGKFIVLHVEPAKPAAATSQAPQAKPEVAKQ